MYIQPVLFIFMTLCILVLSIVIFLMLRSYNRLLKRIEQEEQEKLSIYENMNDKAGLILAETHKKQLEVLEEGKKKVEEMLKGTKDFDEKTTQQMQKNLQDITMYQQQLLSQIVSNQTKSFESEVAKLKQDDLKILKDIENKIEATVDQDLDRFSKDLQKETVGVEAELKQRSDQEYQQIQKELEEYKRLQYQKIQKNIFPLVKQITTELIGKSIQLKDQEDLIIQAIEESKGNLSTTSSK